MSDVGVGPDNPPFDRVAQILDEAGIEPFELDSAGQSIVEFLRQQDPNVPRYLVPQDGTVLTGPMMAGEIASGSEVGRSFVELFVAGAVRRAGRDGLDASLRAIAESPP